MLTWMISSSSTYGFFSNLYGDMTVSLRQVSHHHLIRQIGDKAVIRRDIIPKVLCDAMKYNGG